MSVHKKLMQARIMLQKRDLKKSGQNKFAGYSYFELADFIPDVQAIFVEVGLCGLVSFHKDYAELTITDVEDGTFLIIETPMAEAQLKGAHPIQNLGAVQSYLRRYLWMTAMEIVEHDCLDASSGVEEKPKAKPKVEAKQPEPKSSSAIAAVPSDAPNWGQCVVDAATTALDLCDNVDDVMSIYKQNRVTFDRLKEVDALAYESLMKTFSTVKESLKNG